MKSCLLCGFDAEDTDLTCRQCGEASWRGASPLLMRPGAPAPEPEVPAPEPEPEAPEPEPEPEAPAPEATEPEAPAPEFTSIVDSITKRQRKAK